MKVKVIILFFISLFVSIPVFSQKQEVESATNIREHILLDAGWRFALGHASDYTKDFTTGTSYFSYLAKTGYGDGAAATSFDDRSWREVDLPHDWATELPFSADASHSHGYKTIGWKYPETSVGWYRKKFTVPATDTGRKISIQFDGIYRNSTVWVNGFCVGNEPDGYASSVYDITDYLNYGGENTVAVRVDASIEEGWFYEGAGIYRHVWLNITDRLHVAQYGTFITSVIHDDKAELTVRTKIENQYAIQTSFTIDQSLINSTNLQVGSVRLENVTLKGNLQTTLFQKIKIEKPILWSLENPYLYKLITTIQVEGKIVDTYTTNVGIRTVRFDPDSGFFLNGKNVKIKGTNNHQDHAGVGTAIPDALQEFRVKKLKEMGNNAIRTSHNPATPELLDICDRLGMLVMEENRLMGINQEHFEQLERFMVRDRNHPCIIIWSLGNEEWAIESNEKGARITKTMQEFAQKIDSSRAFTVAVSGGWDNGSGKTAQVMGYNYIVQGNIDEHHRKFPWQSGIGTEESNTIGTRGVYVDDTKNGHMAGTNRMPENVGTESGWKFYDERPFLAGLFFWTGFDYRGEANPLSWPAVNSEFGIVDLCGFPKDIFYYLKSWWGTKPVIHIMPHWNWEGMEGKNINVTIYSNAEQVELFLNNTSLGLKPMPKNGHLDWNVNYKPGELMAKGYNKGKLIVTQKIETTKLPASIELSSDRLTLNADGADVAIITVQVNDQKNRLVPTAGNDITFSLTGPGKIIGVGNGDPASHEPEQFVDSSEKVSITNLKYLVADSTTTGNELKEIFDDSNWKNTFQKEYKEIEAGKNVILRGTFNLPDTSGNMIITFFANEILNHQSIYVNGKLSGNEFRKDDSNQGFILDNSNLHKGENTVVFEGKLLLKKQDMKDDQTNPGIMKVYHPALQWKRKTFNGLAQIIVKTTKQEGVILLTASSKGLKSDTLKINSTISISRK